MILHNKFKDLSHAVLDMVGLKSVSNMLGKRCIYKIPQHLLTPRKPDTQPHKCNRFFKHLQEMPDFDQKSPMLLGKDMGKS